MQRTSSGTLTNLMLAAAMGRLPAVRRIIEHGVDINTRGPRNATALMFAASSGNLEIVQELVKNGADVSATEDGGWNAKRHAEEDGYRDIARFLADIEQSIRPKWGSA